MQRAHAPCTGDVSRSAHKAVNRTGEDQLKAKARSRKTLERAFGLNNPGDFLLSHAVSRAVPSAPAGLTSVFGMGTGVTLPTKSPENRFKIEQRLCPGKSHAQARVLVA